MTTNLSPQVKEIIALGRKEALRLQSSQIYTEHLLLGILQHKKCLAFQIIQHLDAPIIALQDALEEVVQRKEIQQLSLEMIAGYQMPLHEEVESILKLIHHNARFFHIDTIGTGHLLLAILEGSPRTSDLLEQFAIGHQRVEELVMEQLQQWAAERKKAGKGRAVHSDAANINQAATQTPVLDGVGRDLSKLAEEGRLDPIIGRDQEIERVAQILSRRKKNNALLIGEPGVGKTAIAEGLALRIVLDKVPEALRNKRVVALDMAALTCAKNNICSITVDVGSKSRSTFKKQFR